MARFFKIALRAALALSVLLALAIATRRYWVPERFVVNVPLRAIVGTAGGATPENVAASLRPPPGFTLTLFAKGVENARFMRVADSGDVLVSQPREGKVTLLFADANMDGVSDGSISLVSGLDRPHGLALRGGYLYVAEMTAVGRIAFAATARKTEGAFERVITGLPGGGNHWTRTIGFGPDGFLYVSVGSSCNVCIEEDERRAAISRYDPLNWRGSVVARGLRNSVGLAWRTVRSGANQGTAPVSELFATDNGRDLLGNDFPPCELNRVVEGGFYGWPFANGNRVKDPDLGEGREQEIAASLPPVHTFAAHNAPLGLTFLDADSTPPEYKGAALVALHGSWNRTSKDGYKVVSLHWDAAGRITERDFLTGFLENENVIGRPVDLAQARDGAIYVSDDLGGSVFRVMGGLKEATTIASGPASAVVPPPQALPLDPSAAQRGGLLWEENKCALCHDPKVVARGESPVETPKLLQNLTARYNLQKMITYLGAPQPPMPLFEMSERDRHDLATYVLFAFR